MKHFHGTYKKVCDKHDPEYYAKFKKVSQPLTTISVARWVNSCLRMYHNRIRRLFVNFSPLLPYE